MSRRRSSYVLLVLVFAGTLTLSGCWWVGSAIDSGMSAAGEAVGEEVGRAFGDQLAARMNLPAAGTGQWNRFMASQAQVFFSHATAAGGTGPGT